MVAPTAAVVITAHVGSRAHGMTAQALEEACTAYWPEPGSPVLPPQTRGGRVIPTGCSTGHCTLHCHDAPDDKRRRPLTGATRTRARCLVTVSGSAHLDTRYITPSLGVVDTAVRWRTIVHAHQPAWRSPAPRSYGRSHERWLLWGVAAASPGCRSVLSPPSPPPGGRDTYTPTGTCRVCRTSCGPAQRGRHWGSDGHGRGPAGRQRCAGGGTSQRSTAVLRSRAGDRPRISCLCRRA